MNNIEQMSTLLINQWGVKPLEDLRRQAKSEATGIAFDAVRVAGGKRLMLVICVTTPDQIKLLQKAFVLTDGGAADEDWEKLTLLEVAMRAAAGPGFAYESLKNPAGDLSALILVSTEPRSMAIIERLFTMPK